MRVIFGADDLQARETCKYLSKGVTIQGDLRPWGPYQEGGCVCCNREGHELSNTAATRYVWCHNCDLPRYSSQKTVGKEALDAVVSKHQYGSGPCRSRPKAARRNKDLE